MHLPDIQAALVDAGIDGWLLFDFRRRDDIACRVLGLDDRELATRRWFYLIPATGEPVKIVHRIEARRLEDLPGRSLEYSAWRELHAHLRDALAGLTNVAMQYSPLGNLPTISLVDAGTVELVRSMGVTVIPSADLVQRFEARLDESGIDSHRLAGQIVQKVKDDAFALITHSVRASHPITERDVYDFILRRFDDAGVTCEGHGPIVAVNANAADPHFEVPQRDSAPIRRGDAVLIDLWAKLTTPGAVYYDITWCGFVGRDVPAEYATMFRTAVAARDAAKSLIVHRFARHEVVLAYEADDAARAVIDAAGYGPWFTHRTGHSIGPQLHGNGANLDNLETRDDRRLIPGLCFSIEPGIYKPPFGVRTEINVVLDLDGNPRVFGPEQQDLLILD